MEGRGDGPSEKGSPRSARASVREPRPLPRLPEPAEADADLDDENFLFHLYRGSELLQDGREHEAKEELEQALLRKPGDQKGQDLLAVVYFRVGLFSRAIAIYEQLQQKRPKDSALRLNLALCHLKAGHVERARDELELLLDAHPEHQRAWGYLGLCLERLGDYPRAQSAFEKSGHTHMARRMVERVAARAAAPPAAPTPPSQGTHARAEAPAEAPAPPPPEVQVAEPKGPPSTRDGPPPMARFPTGPEAGGGAAAPAPPPTPEPPTRRKTLLVAPPPPGSPALRETLHVPLLPPPSAPARAFGAAPRTLPPAAELPDEPALSWASGKLVTTPPGALPAPSLVPPPSAAHFARATSLALPGEAEVSQHASGVVIVRPTVTRPFATRLESIRAMSGVLDSKILERKRGGHSLGETFGGLGSPLVELTGDGHLVVGPKPGHLLWSFVLDGSAPCTVREDRVLGFQLSLGFDNELVELGASELRVVRYAGAGALVLETSSALVSLAVTRDAPVVVRREVVVGWLGGLDVTPVLPADAPGAHHGLLRMQGEGSVLASGL